MHFAESCIGSHWNGLERIVRPRYGKFSCPTFVLQTQTASLTATTTLHNIASHFQHIPNTFPTRSQHVPNTLPTCSQHVPNTFPTRSQHISTRFNTFQHVPTHLQLTPYRMCAYTLFLLCDRTRNGVEQLVRLRRQGMAGRSLHEPKNF